MRRSTQRNQTRSWSASSADRKSGRRAGDHSRVPGRAIEQPCHVSGGTSRLPNDWRSAAWTRASAAAERHVSFNVRYGSTVPPSVTFSRERMAAGHAPTGEEYSTSSMRCSPIRERERIALHALDSHASVLRLQTRALAQVGRPVRRLMADDDCAQGVSVAVGTWLRESGLALRTISSSTTALGSSVTPRHRLPLPQRVVAAFAPDCPETPS
jgi:hypothetical protein